MHYCVAEVRAIEDFDTKRITVKGTLGIAPDSETVIEYPVRVYEYGYWNRTNTRAAMQRVKRELLREAKTKGFTRDMLTQPIQLILPWR